MAPKSATVKDAQQGRRSGTTPFEQIRELEEAEAKRLQAELDAMQGEKEEFATSLREKEKRVEEELKDAARAELETYREQELAPLSAAAEAEGKKEAEALERAYEVHADSAATNILDTILQPDFFA